MKVYMFDLLNGKPFLDINKRVCRYQTERVTF